MATAPTPEPTQASTTASTTRHAPAVFGWREHVDIPGWGIRRLRAKLDTGARTSALHVEDFEEIEPDGATGWGSEEEGGLPLVRFHVLTGPRAAPRRMEVTTPVVGHTVIRDTRARPEQRPIVRARVICGPLDREIEISLTDRTGMNFRLLLGRLALEGAALVDPAHGFRVTDPPRRPLRPDLEDRE
ncbi:ATP-dependent zinc protease family protein [Nitriliruptor alkaliphilus]|uniref:ATP-dependent zinc protease family protein n=1 Tax=Nitriliruptor alkaliphilus TaxID=427918 RepID=UPI000697F4FC|nr:RimK/LysX family protein [Nitriliruptor alkaliphilus]